MGIAKKYFGVIEEKEIVVYTITNAAGMKASVSNYGATLIEIITKDKNEHFGNVILGFDQLEGYLQKGNPFIGSLIGRYANRIGNAQFTLNNILYHVGANNNGNMLHGGVKGFDKVVWEASPLNDGTGIEFNYTSKDGEEGFPGELNAKVVYSLKEDNALQIEYIATTNKATPVSLTSHAYFNLSAGLDDTILNHQVYLNADKYIPVNDQLIPTGKIEAVQNTPMDFTTSKSIGKDISLVKGGYDHSWVLNKKKQDELSLAAEVYDKTSGRLLTMYTTEPALQFYTGNFLDGSLTSNNGIRKFVQHSACCLEAQRYPDSPNQPSFPNTILAPGETYRQTTIYQFSIK